MRQRASHSHQRAISNLTSRRLPHASWLQPPDHPTRVARRKNPRRDVVCDHAAGADHRPVPNAHAGQDDRAAAEPDIIPDPDRLAELEPLAALCGAQRVACCIDVNGRAAQDEVAERNGRDVQHHTIGVEKTWQPTVMFVP